MAWSPSTKIGNQLRSNTTAPISDAASASRVETNASWYCSGGVFNAALKNTPHPLFDIAGVTWCWIGDRMTTPQKSSDIDSYGISTKISNYAWSLGSEICLPIAKRWQQFIRSQQVYPYLRGRLLTLSWLTRVLFTPGCWQYVIMPPKKRTAEADAPEGSATETRASKVAKTKKDTSSTKAAKPASNSPPKEKGKSVKKTPKVRLPALTPCRNADNGARLI